MLFRSLVLIEALKAAVLNLPIEKSLGFAYVIPYWKEEKSYYPQFQLGYKGLIQLCLRTKAYKYINADVVYEGEFQSADKLTGHIDLNGERISDEVIGYFAYIETVDGFKKGIYWDKERVRAHAVRYSKSKVKQKLIGAWAENFDEMAIKTVLRNLLSKYGSMSVVNAIESESVPAEVTENVGGAEIEVEAAESDSPEVPAADEPDRKSVV